MNGSRNGICFFILKCLYSTDESRFPCGESAKGKRVPPTRYSRMMIQTFLKTTTTSGSNEGSKKASLKALFSCQSI